LLREAGIFFSGFNIIIILNSGKKIPASRSKKKNILTLVLSGKKILNETKNHNPTLQVKWSVPKQSLEKYLN
jgi:hypothetical protein